MILDTGTKLLRVQVKGTDKDTEKISLSIKMKDKGRERGYTLQDIDFVVIYILNSSIWYIVPVTEISRTVILRPYGPRCSYKKYKNAWHLLA